MMGDYHIPEPVKTKLDVAAISTGAAAYFHAIPWADIAGFLTCVYLGLRIVDVLSGWKKKRK